MKLKFGLTSLALLLSIAITGCSCGKNGEYSFKHVEYTIGEETEKTDCSSVGELPNTVKAVCATITLAGELEAPAVKIDGKKIFLSGSETGVFFKVEDGVVMISNEEEGNYAPTNWTYKGGKLIHKLSPGIEVVYKK